MEVEYPLSWPIFYTASIHNKQHLLYEAAAKRIIIECLQFLVNNKMVIIYGYVIMSNHIHLIWQPRGSISLRKLQTSFATNTAKKLIERMKRRYPLKTDCIIVNKYDRKHQVWDRYSWRMELFTRRVFQQKLTYIHENPVRAGVCVYPEQYFYSSANFYFNGIDIFGIVTHHSSL